jgi:hypothetical protein
MINDNYLNGMAKLAAGQSYVIPSYLAIGSTTGTITASDTQTSGEFDRNVLDTPVVSTNVVKYIGSRTSAEASNEYVNVVSFVNVSTLRGTGDIQANFLIPSLLHTTAFDIEFELWVSFNRSA